LRETRHAPKNTGRVLPVIGVSMSQTATALPDSVCPSYITQNLRIKHAYTGAASEVQGGALAEFYKGVMDRLLKRIQRVRPTAFCSRDFFLLHGDVPAHTAASFCQFLTPQKLQSFITPRTLQIYLRQTIFCSPS
jgi:hypothetical protein